ncbi:MAG: FKBP-type peptidyl-prolyl cis-trans isomerase [Deltaproteobacteria bacterium]|nr:FKBP-type peptidyl-prolyl cis-trans isomerase [Deltaproteobacteria bacterium]
MKSIFVVFAAVLLLTGPAFGADETVFKSQKDKVSYTIGVYSGKNLKQQSIDVDPEIMIKGIKDGLSGDKTLLTDQEMQEAMTAFQKELTAKQAENRKVMAEQNKKEGEAFLAENRKKEGVKTLPSGLQYKVIKEGTGKTPKATDAVVAHYRGTRLDGTEFDSSFKRNQPATFKLDNVIQGWREAVLMMKEGAKWQVFIPSNLAYGENGAGPIPPNAALIFDVELIKIEAEPAVSPKATKPEAKSSKTAEKSSKPAAKPSKPAAGK